MSSPLAKRMIPLNVKQKALSLIRIHKDSDHKGSSGRVVVIGGSRDYVGAPFFAAMAAMRAGVDMLTIVCPPSASVPLKAMSPDLIVRGLIPPAKKLRSEKVEDSSSAFASQTTQSAIKELESLTSKSHAVIIGPGLASDTETEIDEEFVNWIVDFLLLGKNGKKDATDEKAQPPLLPVIIDASGIPLLAKALTRRGEIDNGNEGDKKGKASSDLEGAKLPILIVTPNVNEIKVLYKAATKKEGEDEKKKKKEGDKSSDDMPSLESMAVEVSKKMRCCVLLKGFEEFIAIEGISYGKVNLNLFDTDTEGSSAGKGGKGSNDNAESKPQSSHDPSQLLHELLQSTDVKPSTRRSAGQGDTLSGFVGAFLAWGHLKAVENAKEKSPQEQSVGDNDLQRFIEGLSGADHSSVLSKEQLSTSLQCAVGATIAAKYSAIATEARMKTGRFVTSDILNSVSEVVDTLGTKFHSSQSKL